MNIYTLRHEQEIKRSLREVFRFFENPENLAVLTPRSLNFKILTPSPIIMKAGALIDYTIQVLGVEQRWTTLITSYEPPYRFVDEQIKGPYAFWHHTHTFTETPAGALIKDEVRYAVPFGWAGKIAQSLFVKKELEKIFRFRAETIETHFQSLSA